MQGVADFTIRYTVQDGPTVTIQLTERDVVVGAAPDADIHLDIKAVSQRHVRISLGAGRVVVTDLGSLNGTWLNGQRLLPNQEYDWKPGDRLDLPRTTFELTQTLPASGSGGKRRGELKLTAAPAEVATGQPIRVSLTYQGEREQQVTLQGQSLTPGLEVEMTPKSGLIRPDAPLTAEARVQKRRSFLQGGSFRVRFTALTVSGLFASSEVTVKIRPRYELLALLAPLFAGCAIAAYAMGLFTQQPAITPTAPPPATSMPIVNTSVPVATNTPVPTNTIVPTATPTIEGCIIQCAALGWPIYTVQSGDTLSSLAVAAGTTQNRVAQVNCIANPNIITAGQRICLPFIPTIPPGDLSVQVALVGEDDLGSPYPLFPRYAVTIINIGGRTISGPIRVTSSANGMVAMASGEGWTCAIIGHAAIDCSYSGSAPGGGRLPIISVNQNYGSLLAVQVSSSGDANPANNTDSGFACIGQRCLDQEIWRLRCAADPLADQVQQTPPAPGACNQWRSFGG